MKRLLLTFALIFAFVCAQAADITSISNAIHILPFLRQHLTNSRIQMRVRIVEGNEKHLAYTSTEKLELLMKINPTLGRLRDEFNLTLD